MSTKNTAATAAAITACCGDRKMAAPTTFYLNIVPEGGCSADKSAYKDRLSSLLQWFSVYKNSLGLET
ncbi:hypothetical protein PV326_004512 [Microctonus aethiopoides]|nr:hypothetical protein PV326_004512 [Microctonus aethiopoides]